MAHLIWQDSDDLGIASVDAQHRELASLVNALEAASGDGVKMALNRLLIFARTHFDHEAALFRATPYPDAVRHEQRHTFLLLILGRFIESCDRGPQDADPLLGFLRGWLMDHIRHDDRDFAAYVLAQQEPYALSA